MDFLSSLKNIRPNRKAILFLGAGFSNAARNKLGLETPTGSQLSERILDRININGSANLSLAVDKIKEKLPPAEAYAFLSDQLSVQRLTDEQEYILSLPWSRIYTTNIDNIGSNFSGRKYRDATDNKENLEIGDFVYLHGCIANCTANNYSQKIKLGEQMYMSNALASSGYNHDLRKDLFSADVVILIGYSMADPNYQEIFYNTADLVNKCFVVSGKPDELSLHRISMFGTNTNTTLSELVFLLKQTNYGGNEEPFRSEITELDNNFSEKDVTQQARQDLLIFGRYNESIARTSWAKDEQIYAVKRVISEQITSVRMPSIVVVHSHLGNGKNIIFDYAKFLLSKKDKRVFLIKAELAGGELAEILGDLPDGSYAFFEGDIFLVAQAVDVIIAKSLVLCVASRSTTLRVATPALIKAAKGRNLLRLMDANKLSPDELGNFHDLIDSMAFWPNDMNDMSRSSRLTKLGSEYQNVSAIVLKIFENQKVRSQILAQWSAAQSYLRPVMDHFILVSYMMMIDIIVPPYLVNDPVDGLQSIESYSK